MAFDAYAHCSPTAYRPWETLEKIHLGVGIDSGLLIQHLGEFDNEYLVQVASRTDGRYRAVVLVDQTDPSSQQTIRKLARHKAVVGIRIWADETRSWLDLVAAAAQEGLDVFPYMPHGPASILEPLLRFVSAGGTTRLVLPHLVGNSRKPIDSAQLRALEALSESARTVLMISGLCGRWDYPYESAKPVVTELLDRWDETRIVWGSNFPVCGENDFARDFDFIASDPWGIGAQRCRLMMEGNARLLWGPLSKRSTK
jgi:predicted TIM-barrel fold metal-dependent hydrolase